MMKNKLNQLLERSFEVLNQNKVLNKVYEVVNELIRFRVNLSSTIYNREG